MNSSTICQKEQLSSPFSKYFHWLFIKKKRHLNHFLFLCLSLWFWQYNMKYIIYYNTYFVKMRMWLFLLDTFTSSSLLDDYYPYSRFRNLSILYTFLSHNHALNSPIFQLFTHIIATRIQINIHHIMLVPNTFFLFVKHTVLTLIHLFLSFIQLKLLPKSTWFLTLPFFIIFAGTFIFEVPKTIYKSFFFLYLFPYFHPRKRFLRKLCISIFFSLHLHDVGAQIIVIMRLKAN